MQLPLLLIALAAATYFLYTQITMNGRRRRRKETIDDILLAAKMLWKVFTVITVKTSNMGKNYLQNGVFLKLVANYLFNFMPYLH